MGNKCLSPAHVDPVYSDRKNSLDTVSSHFQEKFVVRNISVDSLKDEENDKIRVRKSSIILIIGENRIKVATACCIKNTAANNGQKVEVIVATRDPDAAKNALLSRAGVRLIKADMNSPETLLPAIRDSGADTVLLVPPNRSNRSAQTISGISACRRAGVGHVVVLSSTCVERDAPSIFGDQCKLIEAFIKTCKISYTVVRIPILMDNYLSQLQSMAEYGIFYRPVPPNSKRNAITVGDIGMALGTILLTPGSFGDKTLSLNGPLTDCETAAAAFTVALGKPVIYEQVTYDSYRETLLEASMPEWQVRGILELFKMFERQEPFCRGSSQELEDILRRRPSTVYDLAIAAVTRSQAQSQSKSREVSIMRGLYSESKTEGGSSLDMDLDIPLAMNEEGTAVMPYSRLNNFRSVEVALAPSSSLAPSGIGGIVKITLCISSPIPSYCSITKSTDGEKVKEADNSSSLVRCLDQRYCILLDGVFTFMPPFAAGTGTTRAVGSIENRSISLSGYVIRRASDLTISLQGSKGETTTFVLELLTTEDCRRWLNVLTAHVEHVDSTAGSRWLF